MTCSKAMPMACTLRDRCSLPSSPPSPQPEHVVRVPGQFEPFPIRIRFPFGTDSSRVLAAFASVDELDRLAIDGPTASSNKPICGCTGAGSPLCLTPPELAGLFALTQVPLEAEHLR